MATRKDSFACQGELTWLARKIKSKQLRTYLTYASSIYALFYLHLCQRQYNAVSAIAGEIWQYYTGVNPTILIRSRHR